MKKIDKTVVGSISLIIGALTLFSWDLYSNSVENHTKFLKEHGFNSVQLGDHNFYCHGGIFTGRYFSAVNNKGEKVSGKFCTGGVVSFLSESIIEANVVSSSK